MKVVEQDRAPAQLLACPLCTRELGAALVCPRCGEVGRYEGPILDFSSTDFYWSYLLRPELRAVLNHAQAVGVKAAMTSFLAPRSDRGYFDRLLSEKRGELVRLLPGHRRGTVLSLGSGWGSIDLEASRWFQRVVSVDATRENLELVALRAAEAGRRNLSLVRVNAFEHSHLPFADGTFSAAVISHVLEWVGTGSQQGNPEQQQLALLREVRRVLEPGGYAFVAIENRYYAGFWLGKCEPHAGLPFVSVLPRGLADRFSRLITGRPLRNYTHSYNGLRKLLAAAGFEAQRFYLTLPPQPEVCAVIPAEDRDALRRWARDVFRPRTLLHRLCRNAVLALDSLNLLKHLAPEFAVIAQAAQPIRHEREWPRHSNPALDY
jgi:ubiquinone/menaquinone biosynthesis C-methylase UbiE